MVVSGDKCVVANCGDSRIIIGSRARPGAPLKAKDLSTDHTPLLPEEKARVESAGGWVAQDDEESEARVWLDRDMSCGLAMSRSLGDLAFKSIGVTATPEITEHTLTKASEFVIACSDGVWGVMSSQDAVDIVAASSERQPDKKLNGFLAAQELIAEAARRWKDEEGDYRDDITAIVLALPLWDSGGMPVKSRPASPRLSKDLGRLAPASRPASPRLARSPFSSTPKSAAASKTSTPTSGPALRTTPRSPTVSSFFSKKKKPSDNDGDESTASEPKKEKKGMLRRIVSVRQTDLTAPSGSKM